MLQFDGWFQASPLLADKHLSSVEVCRMDNEHAKGAVDIVVGKAKDVVGQVAGNKKLEIEGQRQSGKSCNPQCDR
jgi:hypothetical protein